MGYTIGLCPNFPEDVLHVITSREKKQLTSISKKQKS